MSLKRNNPMLDVLSRERADKEHSIEKEVISRKTQADSLLIVNTSSDNRCFQKVEMMDLLQGIVPTICN